jgi:putative methionine-R-sulfoxide reductase with GAF domain
MNQLQLSDLPAPCFEGAIPAVLGTCAPDGVPNATWLSQIERVDERHVALSCQFFRKTQQNLAADPQAQLLLTNPAFPEQWRLHLRFARQDTSGPVFDSIRRRIEVIAQLTGTEGVMALRSADIFEVLRVERVPVDAPSGTVLATPLRDPVVALLRIAEGIAACRGLDAVVQSGLELLQLHLGLETVSLYLAEDSERTLYALASRGYPESGVGARIGYGAGLIGACAAQRRPIRVTDMARELRFARAVREQLDSVSSSKEREVQLPGLSEAASILSVPLILDGDLFGVLSSESRRVLAYEERDVALLTTAGQLLAQAIARHREDEPERAAGAAPAVRTASSEVLRVRYYPADDSVFFDGEYLIKGLPGRILWLLLTLRESEGRDSFTNRELRLHPLLKLPSYKDNLETRLLMLQRRLQDKHSPLHISRAQRGRLQLDCACRVELERVSPDDAAPRS